MGKLEGQVALITGAARGQGRSHALRLAEEGAAIIAVDSCEQVESVQYDLATPADLTRTVDEVEALGARIIAEQVDVRDLDLLRKVVDHGVGELGRLDVVAANAGITGYEPFDEITSAHWREMIDINLTGAFNTAQAAVPHILKGGRGGAIVFTSSSLTLKARQNLAHYTASKHGVEGLMITLALELAEHSIRVNTVNPTNVDTDMIHNAASWKLFMPDDEDRTREKVAPHFRTLNALPIPWIDPRDVSNALAFLVSDDARYITGVTLPVDAGFGIV
jgi:(+)-trans-carveol dehydrogenase